MKKKRLLKLANFLEHKVPEARFNMRVWFGGEKDKKFSQHECGTTACALGWATVVFPKDLQHSDWDNPIHVASGRRGFNAAKIFFELSIEQVYFLFDASEGSPTDVAARIRRMVAFPNAFYD